LLGAADAAIQRHLGYTRISYVHEIGRRAAFLREVWAELKKVTWPTWVEVVGSTVVVILTSMMFAVMIGIWDKLLSELVIILL